MIRFELDAASDNARALFSDGGRMRVTISRERCYPGLGSAAPDTLEVYRTVAARLLDRNVTGRVIDLGAGAGAGAALLSSVGLTVEAVDSSREAVEFMRSAGVGCEVTQGDAEHSSLLDAGALVLVDVLGLVPDDAGLLRTLARRARRGAPLLGAVVRSELDRPLTAPARRGYTVEALEALFARAGFGLPTILDTTADFIVFETVVAERSAVAEALTRADGATTPEEVAAALSEVAEALGASPGPVESRELLLAAGRLQLEMGEHTAAEEAVLAANTITPEAVRAYIALADLRLRAGHDDDAHALLDHAIGLDPTHAPAWQRLAAIYAGRGELEAAESCLSHASALEPGDPGVATELACRRRQIGDPAGALDALTRLLPYGTYPTAMRGTLGGLAFASARSPAGTATLLQ